MKSNKSKDILKNVLKNEFDISESYFNEIYSSLNRYFKEEEIIEEEEIEIQEICCYVNINGDGSFDFDIYEDIVMDTETNYNDDYKNTFDEDIIAGDYFQVTTWYKNKSNRQNKIEKTKEHLFQYCMEHHKNMALLQDKNMAFINTHFNKSLRIKKLEEITKND